MLQEGFLYFSGAERLATEQLQNDLICDVWKIITLIIAL